MASSMQSSYLPATTDSLAQALEAISPSESISLLYRILEDPSSSTEALRIKEQAISKLSDLLTQEKKAEELRSLLTQLRPFFSLIPKAKTARIVRGIIDAVAKIPGTSDLQISLCKEMVEWTRAEKRTFLRQRVEARLAALLMENKEYSEALNLLTGLIKEVRRLDDKLLLVDIDLLESKLHFSLRNLPKAKASLTAARTAANAIYVPPAQQGTIDLQSGILHAEEKDYKTAYSYFFEAFEAFNALEDPRAVFSLKYMLLCKIMVNQADDVAGIISSKAGLNYLGPDLDAMKAVADAHSKRSLKFFETALRNYKAQLEEDPIVHRHLSSLYDTLMEQNLCRLIEPYSRVEIAHIAEMIELPDGHVEKKLSQMILDKKFAGTLDQGAGCLIIFDDPKTDAIFPATLETITNIGKVVDSLYVRSARIMA
ncbi:26S proteasome non-ATPase regulatory subunit 11 [Apostasia shenzhenica]|uniref:26S proteasome non-ATPase regulatory subunit 11 n=1 Tax=Apostasia shenzhenica TaxID=1088818 RepID=A0A2I0B629_9ASPA|nr:26S proteasome non-ATPase regulatory subunit 11 [Apostasia shenzhenica]